MECARVLALEDGTVEARARFGAFVAEHALAIEAVARKLCPTAS